MSSWLIQYSTQFILNKLNMRGLIHVLIGNWNDLLIDRRSFDYDVHNLHYFSRFYDISLRYIGPSWFTFCHTNDELVKKETLTGVTWTKEMIMCCLIFITLTPELWLENHHLYIDDDVKHYVQMKRYWHTCRFY
jgi:hypothetical protein